ncbi:MAG TPA: hypothetical protein VIJ87_21025, partial [Pyrinomonadaceae bacterium]
SRRSSNAKSGGVTTEAADCTDSAPCRTTTQFLLMILSDDVESKTSEFLDQISPYRYDRQ